MSDESIYDGTRLALPDEVWNFRRGDGIEKAFLLADFILHNNRSATVSIQIDDKKVLLTSEKVSYHFASYKSLNKILKLSRGIYKISN
jgi:hypothetical protein